MPGAVEAYAAPLVVEIPKAEGDSGRVLHQAVRPLGPGVRDAGLEEAEDLRPPGVDGLGEARGLGQVRERDGLVEAVQSGGGRVPVPGRQHLAKPLLSVNRPSGRFLWPGCWTSSWRPAWRSGLGDEVAKAQGWLKEARCPQ